MIKVYKHAAGSTQCLEMVDPAWLQPGSGVVVWVDLDKPTAAEARVLTDVFHFHELSVEDALSEIHHPKVESYSDFLYVILHGIDFKAREHYFQTRDVDFFLGEQYLVTVHPGVSRSIGKVGDLCSRNARILGEGPGVLMHRIIDTMVDNYRPEVDQLHARLDKLEKEIFTRPDSGARQADSRFQARRRLASPNRAAAAGRRRPARAPGVSEHLGAVGVALPRCLRPPGSTGG